MSSKLPRQIGADAEKLAAEFLQQNGYEIIDHNAHFVGSELDLVCRNIEGELTLIEVKSVMVASPNMYELITDQKKKTLLRGMQKWLLEHDAQDEPWRCEVLIVVAPESATAGFVHLDLELAV